MLSVQLQLWYHVGCTRDGTKPHHSARSIPKFHTPNTQPDRASSTNTTNITGEDASVEDVKRHDGAPRLRDGGGEARVVVDAEIMLKPHHRGSAPVPHGGGGIGGDDPDSASVPQDPTVVGRGREKRPEP
jgi:hypothetical protein